MLAVPVAIFMFLRFFGTNKFDVDIYYQNGVDSTVGANCNFPEGQFYVQEELLVNPSQSINVVGFSKAMPSLEFVNMAKRLNQLFANKGVAVELISETALKPNNYELSQVTTPELAPVLNCSFVMSDINQVVLVDQERRIRGYYDLDLDEVDRLIVEINILLDNR